VPALRGNGNTDLFVLNPDHPAVMKSIFSLHLDFMEGGMYTSHYFILIRFKLNCKAMNSLRKTRGLI
jgi:hypothetical protein